MSPESRSHVSAPCSARLSSPSRLSSIRFEFEIFSPQDRLDGSARHAAADEINRSADATRSELDAELDPVVAAIAAWRQAQRELERGRGADRRSGHRRRVPRSRV